MPLNTKFDRNRPRSVKHYLIKESFTCACGVSDDVANHLYSYRSHNKARRVSTIKKKIYNDIRSKSSGPEVMSILNKKLELLLADPVGWCVDNPLHSWACTTLSSHGATSEIRQKIMEYKAKGSNKINPHVHKNIPQNWDNKFEEFKKWVDENQRMPIRADGSMYWFVDHTRRHIKAGNRLDGQRIGNFKRIVLKAKGLLP